MKTIKKAQIILLSVALLGATYAAGYYSGTNSIPTELTINTVVNKQQPDISDLRVDFSPFWDAWKKVEKKFYDPTKLDPQDMLFGAIRGMVRSLGDPYSDFLPPDQSKRFLDDVSGSFEGIGAEIGFRSGSLTIVTPLKGTPADKAGLKSGDIILAIDDKATFDMSLEEAVSLIRGPRGTKVLLVVKRDEKDDPLEINIVRDVINIPILEWRIEKPGDIAYIKLYQFTGNATQEFSKAVEQILQTKSNKLILDLRNNPGGLLDVAIDIAGFFTPRDSLVTIEAFRNGVRNEFRTKQTPTFRGWEVVVLINNGSASASEILAAALRTHSGVTIVGETSFGKGSIQDPIRLKDGSLLKLTIAEWLTPEGESILDKGIKPDVEVEASQNGLETEDDPQLRKAIELLSN